MVEGAVAIDKVLTDYSQCLKITGTPIDYIQCLEATNNAYRSGCRKIFR
jgi:hypothetical protein